ncbi:MAG: putative immunity protein [Methanobacteriaceae archaeon]
MDCAEHVLPLYGEQTDARLLNALKVADQWRMGKAIVAEARKAAVAAHNVARESSNEAAVYVARSVGHSVATAHMADHSLGAAWYALKATKSAGQLVAKERKWQDEQLPREIEGLVLTAREAKKFQKI